MATTKDYLRLAILGGGSKGSCISDTKVSISPNASAGQNSSYATTTAPFDGVVSFGLVATETNHDGAGPWFSVSGKNTRQNLNASWFQTGGSWSFIPCIKGERITYGGSGVKFTAIDFYKSIGGGYKRYLEALSCNRFGGLLWLRLKTTSERTVSKSSILGCRTTTRKLFSLAGQKNTQHRLTGLRMLVISSPRQDPSQSTLAHQVAAWYSWQELSKMWEGIHGGIQSISDSLKDNGIAFRQLVGVQKSRLLLSVGSTLTSANNARMEVAA